MSSDTWCGIAAGLKDPKFQQKCQAKHLWVCKQTMLLKKFQMLKNDDLFKKNENLPHVCWKGQVLALVERTYFWSMLPVMATHPSHQIDKTIGNHQCACWWSDGWHLVNHIVVGYGPMSRLGKSRCHWCLRRKLTFEGWPARWRCRCLPKWCFRTRLKHLYLTVIWFWDAMTNQHGDEQFFVQCLTGWFESISNMSYLTSPKNPPTLDAKKLFKPTNQLINLNSSRWRLCRTDRCWRPWAAFWHASDLGQRPKKRRFLKRCCWLVFFGAEIQWFPLETRQNHCLESWDSEPQRTTQLQKIYKLPLMMSQVWWDSLTCMLSGWWLPQLNFVNVETHSRCVSFQLSNMILVAIYGHQYSITPDFSTGY